MAYLLKVINSMNIFSPILKSGSVKVNTAYLIVKDLSKE